MSAVGGPSPVRALLVPLAIAALLGAALFRERSLPELGVRPPLPTPVVLDELVPRTAASPPAVLEQPQQTPEGLRSLRAQ